MALGAPTISGDSTGADPSFLYSRRIGRAPQGELPDDYDYADVPGGSNILGAAKLTGKVGSWSIGRPECRHQPGAWPRSRWGHSAGRQEVEPLTYYGVYRAQKEMTGGRHGLGVIGTLTARSFDGSTAPGRAELNGNARLRAGRLDYLDKERVWVVSGWAGLSRVSGTAERMQMPAGELAALLPAARCRATSASTQPATSLAGYAGADVAQQAEGQLDVQLGGWGHRPQLRGQRPGFSVPRTTRSTPTLMVGHKWTKPGPAVPQLAAQLRRLPELQLRR